MMVALPDVAVVEAVNVIVTREAVVPVKVVAGIEADTPVAVPRTKLNASVCGLAPVLTTQILYVKVLPATIVGLIDSPVSE